MNFKYAILIGAIAGTIVGCADILAGHLARKVLTVVANDIPSPAPASAPEG